MRRLLGLFKGLILIFLLLTMQLVRWQIVRSDLAKAALRQRSEALPLDSGRAPIFDRTGLPLTGGGSQISLGTFPKLIPKDQKDALPWQLAPILGRPAPQIAEKINKGKPVFLAKGLNKWQLQALKPLLSEGLVVVNEKLRYKEPALAPHIIGYLKASDQSGVSGIEALANEELAHVAPLELAAIVDGNRRLIKGLGFRIIGGGHGGEGLKTTLDSKFQKVAQEELTKTGQRGTVVIADAKTGNILALASNPTFDPNQVEGVMNAPGSPLLNRALHSYYPGSVFKLVVTIAALEEQVTAPEERFFDPGFQDVGRVRFRCWLEGGHGQLNLTEGFAKSCNTVYVELGQRLGLKMIDYAERLGLGKVTGTGLREEEEGSLFRGKYARQDLGNLALGQKGIQITPLQATKLMLTILQGREVKLNLFPGEEQYGPELFTSTTRNMLRAMMAQTVESGTGTLAQVPVFAAGGKTGSAQTGRLSPWGEPEVDAWFVGFFPLLSPRYVIVVLLEGGGSGGTAAAPVFRRIAMKISS